MLLAITFLGIGLIENNPIIRFAHDHVEYSSNFASPRAEINNIGRRA